ncbi:hypothetical protein GCM10023313_06100 [Mucilaginibacter defluvii]|uniref:SusD-like starch-binding protein associating with outer membrane n=2 Tax=Mucilaginibacter defluvii TaxID=1196019 RepID=A0ABP9FLC4_9SPHI
MSCKKGWLDAKPSKSLVVPGTPEEYQTILDNTSLFNNGGPIWGEVASDDHYATDNIVNAASAIERNSYIWAKDVFEGNTVVNWQNAYRRILQCNIVIEGLDDLPASEHQTTSFKNTKGSAYFYRAYDFYNLAQEYCKAYTASTAASDLGIPLRLSANINEKSFRATVQETYDQIIGDLRTARALVPVSPVYKTRPSQAAVYGMLARVYLSMEDYSLAKVYADSCLALHSKLLDYNTLNASASRPFVRFNDEVIFHWLTGFSNITRLGQVDNSLYDQYQLNDLRRTLFYTPAKVFKGTYDGTFSLFNGLATDEILLIRSECLARAGQVNPALSDLNTLLKSRWSNSVPYVPVTASSSTDALDKILVERRKELAYRGLRWTDLRRLNKDTRYAKTITRTIAGQNYQLPPNSQLCVFPIPIEEINASGIPQNPR